MSFSRLEMLLCFASVARAIFMAYFLNQEEFLSPIKNRITAMGISMRCPIEPFFRCLVAFSASTLGTQAGQICSRLNFKPGRKLTGREVGVIISTVQNPTSFDNFSSNGVQQFVSPYAQQASAGIFCIPLNISAANVSGVKDGANVTIQVVWSGGNGNLYQGSR